MRGIVLIFVLALSSAFGCSEEGNKGCEWAGQMRCNGNVAQMCTGQSAGASYWTEWTTWRDCSAVGQSCGSGTSACFGYDIACCR